MIRFMLDGKSLKEARRLVKQREISYRIYQTRKEFQKFGSDLSDYSDEEIERCMVYISRIMEQRSENTFKSSGSFRISAKN